MPTEPKLIPIVTTAEQIDAVALAQTYIHRWSAQENVIKDFLLPLGLDVNHGFASLLRAACTVVNTEATAIDLTCAQVDQLEHTPWHAALLGGPG